MANKKRLIDADVISNGIALYLAENAYLNDTAQGALEMVAKWINEAPTVDAVEVVRCKDCLYRSQYSAEDGFYKCGAVDSVEGMMTMVHPEFFCKCGERRCKSEETQQE